MSLFTAPSGRGLDSLQDVRGFSDQSVTVAGKVFGLKRLVVGGAFTPADVSSEQTALDPNGGLEYNPSDELKIKTDLIHPEGPGLALSSDGVRVVDKVNTGGDTMTGELSMTNNKIVALGTPTGPLDAVTKQYVDDMLAMRPTTVQSTVPDLTVVANGGSQQLFSVPVTLEDVGKIFNAIIQVPVKTNTEGEFQILFAYNNGAHLRQCLYLDKTYSVVAVDYGLANVQIQMAILNVAPIVVSGAFTGIGPVNTFQIRNSNQLSDAAQVLLTHYIS